LVRRLEEAVMKQLLTILVILMLLAAVFAVATPAGREFLRELLNQP